jgi:hypothetical protein
VVVLVIVLVVVVSGAWPGNVSRRYALDLLGRLLP